MQSTPKIAISGSYREISSFAMQQNQVPIVHHISLKNLTNANLENLNLSIVTDPDIADVWMAKIDLVSPENEYRIDGIDVQLSPSKLFALTERINGSMTISVSDESGLIAQDVRSLSFLSYNEWSGSNTYPEFLAAFVTPNHPYITEVMKKAGIFLENWIQSPSFTGYQSKNPNNVRRQMAAIYGALQQENIVYCMPPASFEENGQKLRLCGTIREQKLGTCLDLALLYAGCLEFAGLNPMVIITKGHAFLGCWLEEESFSECVQDDASVLTKRFAPGINEICVVETTAFTAGKEMNFENAVAAAEIHMQRPDDFHYLVDIKRSRGSGIRPIPQRKDDGSYDFESYSARDSAITGIPGELELVEKLNYTDTHIVEKQQMWERKLLDLSLRNSLLNFRVTRSATQLLVTSLIDLADALSSGEEFQILHCPNDMINTPRDSKIYETINSESHWTTLIKSEFQHHRIRTYIDEASLSKSVSNLYRSARNSMEENGANTLHLALGFLKWYESNASEKPRYAPLVMIPVDIIRRSAQRGYVFRLRDEEPIFNITLLEKLRMDFGLTMTGLDPLPTTAQGIDLKTVFRTVRQLVMSQPRWDVEELAFMGIFSFAQFIMWNDIRNRVDALMKNKIVKSLVSGKLEWETNISFLPPASLDTNVTPADLAVPISADSSQLAAIYAAGQGHSFVLHGPPGTGKSQTITNIIANALYQGKSVLFVAEKMAALTVVQKRLTAVGLGDFCLELHSNKARKKDVLDQLENTLHIGRIKSPEEFQSEADSIFMHRRELNDIVNELHKPRTIGFSLYEAISRAEQYSGYPDCISFTSDQLSKLTSHQYAQWEDSCDKLSTAIQICGNVCDHVLKEYKNQHYSQSKKAAVEEKLIEYQNILTDLKNAAIQVCSAIGIGEVKTYMQYEMLVELCGNFPKAIWMPQSVLTRIDLSELESKIIAVCETGIRCDEIKKDLTAAFSEQLLEYDAATSLLQWYEAESSWFLPKIKGKSKITKSVKNYAKDKKSFDKRKIPEILELVIEYHKAKLIVNESAQLFTDIFGVYFNNGTCEWETIVETTKLAISVQSLLKAITNDENSILTNLAAILDTSHGIFVRENRASWETIAILMKKIPEIEATLSAYFSESFILWHNEMNWVSAMLDRIARWFSGLDGLRDYCVYLQMKTEFEGLGLQTITTALENGELIGSEIKGTFVKNISSAFVLHIIDNTPILNTFHGDLFMQKIYRFKELSEKYESLTKQELVARLSMQIPVINMGVSDSSEIGVLQRAIRSGGRAMPVRKLFENIPNLLRKLSPCMLMSPISVAQYLDPKFPAFDLVVFDEASQLPTSEAVGAIARGNELIVVGDPKQLPPTNFFTSNQIDEDNYDKEDLESILDDCLALSMPQEHLLWHYRSRHESLIAFSNAKYYNSKLYTFPSPNNMSSQVRLIPVEGYYDRGKTRQNKAEAVAIVKEIVRRLTDPLLMHRSIGVVTFSSTQQTLIADMLDEEFANDAELDTIANNVDEPIFIKNLENVQGDERDVILFSIGYGPDAQGKPSLNFGPLNREGGWRRLNVAVSRARYEMMIFSVLMPEHIDLNRTRSEGVAGLKSFLEFASRGVTALPTVTVENSSLPQSIVEAIAKRISSFGYAVHTNIGCSEYHVDIGVVHPDISDTYVLGILCDSDNYNNGGTAFDRNVTHESVLLGLGWNIARVWVLDWWDNPDKELSKIIESISTAITIFNANDEKQTMSVRHAYETATISFEKIDEVINEHTFTQYETAKLSPVYGHIGDYEYFLDNYSTQIIMNQITAVLQVETPIHSEVLCRRILESWGISRKGNRIKARFDKLFTLMRLKETKYDNSIWFWNQDDALEQYNDFRVPTKNSESRRSLEHIAPEEIASAVKFILSQQIGIPRDDLEREVSRVFGFARCTEAMQKHIKYGIDAAIDRNWVRIDDVRVTIVDSKHE